MVHMKSSPHILLINPWVTDFAAYNFWIRPLGLLSITGLLRENGFRVTLIDCLDFYGKTKRYGDGNFFKTKIQLRKLLADKLPEIAKRPKKGFGIPLKSWLKGELKDFAYFSLHDNGLYNLVDKNIIKNLWENHQKGYENNSGNIWMLIMLGGWLKRWG